MVELETTYFVAPVFRVGANIADFRLPIFDWPVSIEPIKNLKSAIGNHETHDRFLDKQSP
jgi:hypothetical protein